MDESGVVHQRPPRAVRGPEPPVTGWAAAGIASGDIKVQGSDGDDANDDVESQVVNRKGKSEANSFKIEDVENSSSSQNCKKKRKKQGAHGEGKGTAGGEQEDNGSCAGAKHAEKPSVSDSSGKAQGKKKGTDGAKVAKETSAPDVEKKVSGKGGVDEPSTLNRTKSPKKHVNNGELKSTVTSSKETDDGARGADVEKSSPPPNRKKRRSKQTGGAAQSPKLKSPGSAMQTSKCETDVAKVTQSLVADGAGSPRTHASIAGEAANRGTDEGSAQGRDRANRKRKGDGGSPTARVEKDGAGNATQKEGVVAVSGSAEEKGVEMDDSASASSPNKPKPDTKTVPLKASLAEPSVASEDTTPKECAATTPRSDRKPKGSPGGSIENSSSKQKRKRRGSTGSGKVSSPAPSPSATLSGIVPDAGIVTEPGSADSKNTV